MEAVTRNLQHLERVLESGNWSLLRRSPPVFTWEKNPIQNVRSLVIHHIRTAVETP
jgi:hypothetical protein